MCLRDVSLVELIFDLAKYSSRICKTVHGITVLERENVIFHSCCQKLENGE